MKFAIFAPLLAAILTASLMSCAPMTGVDIRAYNPTSPAFSRKEAHVNRTPDPNAIVGLWYGKEDPSGYTQGTTWTTLLFRSDHKLLYHTKANLRGKIYDDGQARILEWRYSEGGHWWVDEFHECFRITKDGELLRYQGLMPNNLAVSGAVLTRAAE